MLGSFQSSPLSPSFLLRHTPSFLVGQVGDSSTEEEHWGPLDLLSKNRLNSWEGWGWQGLVPGPVCAVRFALQRERGGGCLWSSGFILSWVVPKMVLKIYHDLWRSWGWLPADGTSVMGLLYLFSHPLFYDYWLFSWENVFAYNKNLA